jgi:hypothetical protein
MTEKQRQEKLATLSYLWTSGEWTLQQAHHSRARVVFVFASGQPSPSELLAVRALVPRFTSLPISKLKAEVGRLAEFEVGDMSGIAARRLEKKGREKGLQVRVEDASYTSYLPVSARGAALVIEDHEAAQLAVEEMKRRGVPIVYVECD